MTFIAFAKALSRRTSRNREVDRTKAQKGRKQRSLGFKPSIGGVFVSTRSLEVSRHSLDTAETQSVSGSSEGQSSPPSSWKSSGSREHHKGVPLIVSNPDKPEEVVSDDAMALGLIMARSKQLPGTWYYSSNHIMVNQERAARTVAPLIRLRELDEIAREHAGAMASQGSLFHSTPAEVREKFHKTTRRLGENVAKGENIRSIHKCMMMNIADKNNMVDRRFTHMGMGTAKGKDGKLYLCQVFRG